MYTCTCHCHGNKPLIPESRLSRSAIPLSSFSSSIILAEGGREGGRKGGRHKGGKEGGGEEREGEREGERGREGGREGEREREGGREGGRGVTACLCQEGCFTHSSSAAWSVGRGAGRRRLLLFLPHLSGALAWSCPLQEK